MSKEKEARVPDSLTPDDYWRIYLLEGLQGVVKHMPFALRQFANIEPYLFKFLPSDPRCISCRAPFRGFGVPLMRAIGRQRSTLNPSICAICENYALKYGASAELDLAMVFADVRGSTNLAEKMSPAEFGKLINRFFQVTVDELVNARGMIEKLIGDEVTAFFVPGIAGKHYHRKAIEAAKGILHSTGHDDPNGPWAPVGIGVHSGVTFVGAVGGEDGLNQISVLGDAANTAARLASEAKAGEILISDITAQRAELETKDLEKKKLTLKGKSEALDVWVIKISSNRSKK